MMLFLISVMSLCSVSVSGSVSVSAGGNRANSNKNSNFKFLGQHIVASDESDEGHLGCVWDGVSLCHDSCSPDSMKSRCQRLSHDQAACEGDEGQDYGYPLSIDCNYPYLRRLF